MPTSSVRNMRVQSAHHVGAVVTHPLQLLQSLLLLSLSLVSTIVHPQVQLIKILLQHAAVASTLLDPETILVVLAHLICSAMCQELN